MFEEWYFKKLDHDLKKKQTEQAKEEARLYNDEMEKLEKKENAAIEYEKWLRQKKEQYVKATRRKIRRDASKEKVVSTTILISPFKERLILFRFNKTRLIFYIFLKDSEEKQERIRKAEQEWKEKKIKERRQAQKRLQKKAKKEIEEEKKKIEKRSESSKTFQSWQVKDLIASNIYMTIIPSAIFYICVIYNLSIVAGIY